MSAGNPCGHLFTKRLRENGMTKKKNIYSTAFFSVLPVLVLAAVLTGGCRAKGITAEEWLIRKYDTLDLLELFCTDMDEIVSMYLTGSMTTADYLEQMGIIEKELSLMEKEREENEEKIRPGTHTEETKTAKDHYDAVWSELRELVNALLTQENLIAGGDELAYFYMAYNESITGHLKGYADGYLSAVS